MKESYWGYFLILLGIFVIVIMMLVNNVTTSSTQDYYLLKEVTQAAMLDSIDFAHYRAHNGEIRIIKEKFIENFLRRVSETVNINNTYTFDFYDIYECPPKVSVRVSSKTGTYVIGDSASSFDLVTKIDGIIEDGLDTPESVKQIKKN